MYRTSGVSETYLGQCVAGFSYGHIIATVVSHVMALTVGGNKTHNLCLFESNVAHVNTTPSVLPVTLETVNEFALWYFLLNASRDTKSLSIV